MMQTYPALIDSGLDWLGKIPAHWETVKAKWLFDSISEKNFPEEPLLSATQEFGVVPRDILEDRVMMPMGELVHFKLVQRGDFVISLRSFQGGVEYSDYQGLVSPAYTVLRNKKPINKAYFRYLMKSFPFISELQTSVTGIREGKNINYKDFAEIVIPNPPLEEQARIANFIEEQTAVIDQFIGNKRRLIALLEEQKQVAINTAVTQGLDPNAPRKPSSIDWLDDIPAHWKEVKLKNLSEFIQTGPFGSQLHAHDYVDNEVPVINPIHLHNGQIVPDWSVTVDSNTLARLSRHQLKAGDVIFARRGELGRCAVVEAESAGWLCGTGSMNLRPKPDQVFSPYLAQVIQTEVVKTWLTLESVGSTMDNLNGTILGNLSVPIPPLDEQRQIILSCQEMTQHFNATIERAQCEIDLIEEYRTTLIAHAVTGKIDVRGAA